MNLNLRFGRAQDGPNSWSNRKKAYPPLLHAHCCDFYCFQEANDFQVDFLSRQLPGFGFVGQRRPAPKHWQSNVIFYHPRWRCLFHHHFYLSKTPDIPSRFTGSKWPRQCTMARFACGAKQLAVTTTHFDFDGEIQRRSAKLIMKRVNALHPLLPAVIAGDFNAVPGSRAYSEFTNGRTGFNNAFASPYAGTYHGFSGNAQGEPIDWILYRGPVKLRHAAVIAEMFDGIYPSDHFPLLVAFTWP